MSAKQNSILMKLWLKLFNISENFPFNLLSRVYQLFNNCSLAEYQHSLPPNNVQVEAFCKY